MSAEQRRHERATAHAKAVFVSTTTPGYLRDVSASGCQVAFMAPVPAREGQTVTVQVVPVHDPAIAPFHIQLDVRWVRNDPLWYLLGGRTRGVTPQDGESLARVVEYYRSAPEA
ncbi:MAG TPA: PilZ domain-containing protein [Spirochaetia bacterium]|nr:PilZ domain-containing protein [Spirochaetia bacterium]